MAKSKKGKGKLSDQIANLKKILTLEQVATAEVRANDEVESKICALAVKIHSQNTKSSGLTSRDQKTIDDLLKMGHKKAAEDFRVARLTAKGIDPKSV